MRNSLLKYLGIWRDNIVIVESTDAFTLQHVEDGVIMVHASWSGAAIQNNVHAIRKLYALNYPGKIIVIDIDCASPEFQKDVFGVVCHGWGEIFIVETGVITRKFIGKDCVAAFSVAFN